MYIHTPCFRCPEGESFLNKEKPSTERIDEETSGDNHDSHIPTTFKSKSSQRSVMNEILLTSEFRLTKRKARIVVPANLLFELVVRLLGRLGDHYYFWVVGSLGKS